MLTVAHPRIAPGGPRELGRLRWALLWLATRRRSGGIPNIFLLLGRHRRAFMPWLWYASRLMPGGLLARAETELIILRVAARTGSAYERLHHETIARSIGLSEELIAWTAEPTGALPPQAEALGIDAELAALLCAATDELLATHDLSDATWHGLAGHYDEPRLIEVCMLVGQYAGLAATLNAMRVPLDEVAEPIGR